MEQTERLSLLDGLIHFCLANKLVVFLMILLAVVSGVLVAPFDWEVGGLERHPVPVDAIPDIGENQQIVFTRWMGRSPQDVEDQVTYPLTTALLGLPKVRTIRSFSFFGFSSIYVIFHDDAEFYWSRSRVLEKLNSLPSGTLPPGVQPALGPDATALGQIFWYTLEGQDPDGNPTGGWDPQELRTIQDWNVRYALMGAEGVSEAASVGGFVKEYQVDVDPDAMRAHRVSLHEVFNAVRMSNIDVGARTIEVNRVEYVIRGLGFIRSVKDLEDSVIKVNDNVPIYVKNVATVSLGPALRRGALDKAGAEAVGGVVVVRYGYNPLQAIKNVKKVIKRIAPGLDKKAFIDFDQTDRREVEQFAREHRFAAYRDGVIYDEAWMEWLSSTPRKEWPQWATISQVAIVPFYDRTSLIYETLGTLNTALTEEILVTIIVVILMVLHMRSALLISGLLPLAVLMCFMAMKAFHVDANIVALSGIAIAIGTMVDMGIVVCENILRHLAAADPEEDRLKVVFRATSEVGSAVLTAVATTVVSFLPVFMMQASEGKLFKPLAYTKTFALIASIIVALTVIPPLAHLFIARRFGWHRLLEDLIPPRVRRIFTRYASYVAALLVAIVLANHWQPLGPEKGIFNILFVVFLIGGLMSVFALFQRVYEPILRFFLRFKLLFLPIPLVVVLIGAQIWQGMGKEFMPPLDEGSYLFMPTTMPHASNREAMDVLIKLDRAIQAIPEVESAVGKLGRVESALDPAPISMFETIVNYKPEYRTGKDGRRLRFKYAEQRREFIRNGNGELVPDPHGRAFRQWRPHIKTPDDIWKEIIKVTEIPGTTSAPKLQPIAARIVMLQSGMRAPMGVKVFGPDLETIDRVGLQIEKFLKQVPSIEPATVIADRIVGKPYLEVEIDREAIARYGVHIRKVQDVIEVAIGGKKITTTVEGRERYPVRVRYQRELRDDIQSLGRILVPTWGGAQIPLEQLAHIRYLRGPQAIKSEDTYLVGYVVFDMKPGYAEVEVVEQADAYLKMKEASGEFNRPSGVWYKFAGNYENQIRAEKRMMIVLPFTLFTIFLILYLLFRSVSTTLLVFSGVFVAWAGGFMMLWLYGQNWFLNFTALGIDMRELFQVRTYNLSVAVWVGFLALFGIATDNGVILATYLDQSFSREKTDSIQGIRDATVLASMRRIRPCLMTAATTILALLPVLTSTGRGADVMVPMAIPSFGGMIVVLVTVFVVPVLYAQVEETKLWWRRLTSQPGSDSSPPDTGGGGDGPSGERPSSPLESALPTEPDPSSSEAAC